MTYRMYFSIIIQQINALLWIYYLFCDQVLYILKFYFTDAVWAVFVVVYLLSILKSLNLKRNKNPIWFVKKTWKLD